ncbi:hypothetical protein [Streptomyces sp. M54]|uniref:hypothetical protein n=1 Tax=Streptomyces sp. M54 TaxID=2759525 RepID=UPI001A8E8E80|nr:hypothetical protein [Streptomyces sp. M54]QSS92772.1 hypothetical protein H3V39_21975 [Streptomyces sp. M54]
MPHWITPRRLGAAAVLYAVFAGGWYLGQPLPHVGCAEEAPAASAALVTVEEPGDLSGGFDRVVSDFGQAVTRDVVPADAVVACDPYTARPRLMAWVIGDWR